MSTPVETSAPRHSTIHFAQSPAPVAQPSFPQVFDGGLRPNATLASQMPVLKAKAIRVPGPSRLESQAHIQEPEDSHFATRCDCDCKYCHAINYCRHCSG